MRYDWEGWAEQLRARPGEWARIPGPDHTHTAHVESGRIPAFRYGRWQAASRGGVLYIRYLGPERQPPPRPLEFEHLPDITKTPRPRRQCSIGGCTRPRLAKKLCAYHYQRAYRGKPVEAGPCEGDPSGFGQWGIVERDEDQVLCHECGHWFASVAGHIHRAHGLRAREYRRRHGIPSGTPLVSLAISRQQSALAAARVGTEQWQRLEAVRDPGAAQKSRTPESFQRRGRAAAAEQARVNGRTARAAEHPCEHCGRVMTGRGKTCSPECRSALVSEQVSAHQQQHRVALTPAEGAALAAAADPGPLVRHHQHRGVSSSALAQALGKSGPWMSQNHPRPR